MKKQKKKIIPASKGYEFWEEKIQEYKKRGLTQVEFCKENRLAVSTFTSWLRKLRAEAKKRKKFIPLKIIEAEKSIKTPSVHPGFPQKEEPSFYEVRFKNGVRLSVPAEHDLKELIAALV